jgi:signal peptidase I
MKETDRPKPTHSATSREGILRKAKAFLTFMETPLLTLALVVVLRTFAFASYHIPTESMVPTLEVGDRIGVSKFAFGYSRHAPPISLPFGHGRLFGARPDRGEVVVFYNEHDGRAWVKRVIGLPGDTVQMRHGRLFINGEMVPREFRRTLSYRDAHGVLTKVSEYEERLPGGVSHSIFEVSDYEHADNTAVYRVPENMYFLMGDNRDNSRDSRYSDDPGFVAWEDLLGSADRVLFSLHRCQVSDKSQCPHHWRLFSAIE